MSTPTQERPNEQNGGMVERTVGLIIGESDAEVARSRSGLH
jgi:hypothetical protein